MLGVQVGAADASDEADVHESDEQEDSARSSAGGFADSCKKSSFAHDSCEDASV